jgi:hypothetical protein
MTMKRVAGKAGQIHLCVCDYFFWQAGKGRFLNVFNVETVNPSIIFFIEVLLRNKTATPSSWSRASPDYPEATPVAEKKLLIDARQGVLDPPVKSEDDGESGSQKNWADTISVNFMKFD